MDAAPLIKSRKALGKMKAIVWAAGLITLIATICQPVSAHVYNATLGESMFMLRKIMQTLTASRDRGARVR